MYYGILFMFKYFLLKYLILNVFVIFQKEILTYLLTIFQRYDKELVVGLTQGGFCLCGYDYQRKQAVGGFY